jgi:hypothetical protein
LRALLSFTEDLLNKHDIFHFLDYGSLLGAVRSQKLIEWDEDADLSCLETDFERIMALQPEIEAAGFWLDTAEAPHVLRICRSRTNQLHADLWFQRVEGEFAYTWSRLHQDRYRFPVQYLKDTGEVMLEGRTHRAPMPVERFLAKHRYGADFMTPRRMGANFGWISGAELTPEVLEALETLRETEYRIECLTSQQKIEPSGERSHGWRLPPVPAWALRLHRSLWKAKQRLGGTRSGALLELQYELLRRRAVLHLLESQAGRSS